MEHYIFLSLHKREELPERLLEGTEPEVQHFMRFFTHVSFDTFQHTPVQIKKMLHERAQVITEKYPDIDILTMQINEKKIYPVSTNPKYVKEKKVFFKGENGETKDQDIMANPNSKPDEELIHKIHEYAVRNERLKKHLLKAGLTEEELEFLDKQSKLAQEESVQYLNQSEKVYKETMDDIEFIKENMDKLKTQYINVKQEETIPLAPELENEQKKNTPSEMTE